MKDILEDFGLFRWVSSVVLCLFFLGIGIKVAWGAAIPSTGHVSGTVSGPAGLQLGGAQVKFAAGFRGMQISVFTQKDGGFGIDLPAGSYRVTAMLRGYGDHTQDEFAVKAGQPAELKIALNPVKDGLGLEGQMVGAELFSILPADERRTLINRCGACHSLGLLGGKRRTPAEFASLVERMSHKEPEGRGEGDTLSPWETNPWTKITPILEKQFGTGVETHRYEPLPLKNDLDHLSKVVMKEYDLQRPETLVHEIGADTSGKRIWYGDVSSGEIVDKKGAFGWYDPATGESKEYKVPQCLDIGKVIPDKAGRVWVGCGKAVAYWDPKTDAPVIFPVKPGSGWGGLDTVDSKGNGFAILRARLETVGDKFAYVVKFDPQTREATKYKVPTLWGNPYELIADSKDNIWISEIAVGKIGKLDQQTGTITEYAVPTKGGAPRRVAVDSKDNLWFTEFVGNKIGMVDSQTGKVTEYDVPTPYALPYALGIDRNDMVWFGEMAANRLGRLNPKTKMFREYPIPSRLSSTKKLDFTYSDGRTIVWSGYRTGPKLVAFEMPKE